ncbi:MAG: hypothetical protein M3174_06630 [Actinomycetota bacterium]|nr:hypothetical protein [Actinomycetota bacterium]
MRGRLVVTGVLAGVFLLPTASLGDTFNVRATEDDTWRPATREIHRGDKVVWRNPTDDLHNVTAYGSNWDKSSNLAPGTTTSKRFRRRGTYKYVCTIHGQVEGGQCEGMCGRIRVLR